VYGITVTATQIGGAVAPTLTPIIADRFGWEAALQLAGALAVFSAFLWLFIDAAKRILPAREPSVTGKQLATAQ
jgi:cyanate permease